jgi:deoxyadenosine/deoxycytidine kinase
MKKPLRIISVDGVRGAGKTTQINMLSRYLKSLGYKVSTLMGGEDIQHGLVSLAYVDSFLPKDPDSIVILDGSIARMMVVELVSGISPSLVSDKYKRLVYEYERLNHQYGILGLLFVMDDLEECKRRILKRNTLAGIVDENPSDLLSEIDVISGMRTFDNHITSKNIKFHTFNIDPKNTMLEIQKLVLEYLSTNYQLKKPKIDPNDW